MRTYKITLGTGTRTVEANSEMEALEKATGRPASRFTKQGVGEYKETACAAGHQGVYAVRCTTRH